MDYLGTYRKQSDCLCALDATICAYLYKPVAEQLIHMMAKLFVLLQTRLNSWFLSSRLIEA